MASELTTPPSELTVASMWKFSVEQYHQMIETGTLTENDPVELIEGWIVTKMPKKSPHRITTRVTRGCVPKMVAKLIAGMRVCESGENQQ
jgi:predicted DNA-binding protein (UPF0278 family)